jgi:hypothetical protein
MTLPRYPDCSVILFVCSPLKYLKMADSDIAALRSYVIRILPRLTPGEIDKVMERLDELGVDEIGSFKFVQVQQLESVLKPVYIAKLIASAVDATDADSTTLDQTSTPSSQHSRHIPLSPIDVQQHQVEQTTPRRAAPSDPNWAMSFSVLWDEVPKKILNLLHEGKRLQKTERCNLVRCVVASVRQICDRPIRKELEYIAQKMMMAYPGSLREELGGDVVGTGYDSLLSQLTARVENEHRLSTRNSLSQLREKHSAENENEATSASFARSKIMKRDLYGCVRWQQSLPVGETDESQQQQQQLLLELHETTPWNVAAVEQSMKKTYPTQRSDINNGLMGGIVSLKGKWPFIFVPVGMFVHVEELLDFNMADVMKNSLMSKGPRIIGYLSSQTNQFIKTTLAEMNQAKGVLKSSEPEVPAMLLCIMSILSEETNVLLTLLDVSNSCHFFVYLFLI